MFLNRKISLGAAVALLLVAAAVVFSITMTYATKTFNASITDLRQRERAFEKYSEIDRLVRQNFNAEINATQLQDSVAQGYLTGIGDQYGRYYTAEEYKKLVEESEGENVGIGAVIDVAPDDFYLHVVEVYPDSPAEVAGIQADDLLIKIDDVELSSENNRQMLESIQGPAGSNITIVTRRGSTENPAVTMTRRAVAIPTVLNARILEDSTVGYLQISEFRDRTYDQFNRDLIRLIDAGATSLIIDLRDNNSETLRTAARILDKLLGEGVLVSAVYKDGTSEVLYTSDANEIDLPIVVLTNANTTGTSEVFAQAVKDFGKGRTVGTTTAGKGVMQNIIKLSDGSAIKLSVATYLTLSGESFHSVGVKADFEVAMEGDWTIFTDNESGDAQLVKAKEVAIGMQNTASAETQTEASSTDADAPQTADESISAAGEG